MNPLEEFFNSRKPTDRGIWKWRHYFDVYWRHLFKFAVRSDVKRLLEIGVYGGGSLDMWRNFLSAEIHGVDIDPACKRFEQPGTVIHIGDQEDRSFWATFRKDVPPLDIVIDDGGHNERQQLTAWRELCWHLNPGGVYIVEDVEPNAFLREAMLMMTMLQPSEPFSRNMKDDERSIVMPAAHFQAHFASIHTYPGMVVLERTPSPIKEFVATRKGLLP